jgi:hypothetical protein
LGGLGRLLVARVAQGWPKGVRDQVEMVFRDPLLGGSGRPWGAVDAQNRIKLSEKAEKESEGRKSENVEKISAPPSRIEGVAAT